MEIFNLYFILIFLLAFLVSFKQSSLFHAYRQNFKLSDVSENCQQKYNYFEKPIPIEEGNKYGLWPNLINHYQMEFGETLFGFYEAMETFWKNQNPPDCKSAKFMVSTGYPSGFGSEVHVEGLGFTHALNTGRVYLQHRGGPEQLRAHMKWQTENTHCRNQKIKTLECYFLPWSNCTLSDAFGDPNPEGKKIPEFLINNSTISEKERTVYFVNRDSDVPIIPNIFEEMMSCSPFNETHKHYWWRAIIASYILRPNPPTLQALKKYGQDLLIHPTFASLPSLKQTTIQVDSYTSLPPTTNAITSISTVNATFSESGDGTRWVGVYVRHGDKHVEMALQPFSKYAETIEKMMSEGKIQNIRELSLETGKRNVSVHARSYRNLFIGSEDPKVLSEADEWGKRNDWTVKHTSLFDRESVSAFLPHSDQLHQKSSNTAKHHDLEYLSMLLNLEMSLKCDAWVCTHPSNWCRLIDELRATIGGKANFIYADISPETCLQIPCMDGLQMKSFDYR